MPQQHHIALSEADAADYVLIPGDPARSEAIAAYLDNPSFVGSNREFCSWHGYLEGERILICSGGVGAPSTAIAAEELIAIGAKTLIRVGTSGSLQDWITPGDIAVVNAAIRDEGTSLSYLPLGFPAVADFEVTSAFLQGARSAVGKEISVHLGVTQSKDSYVSQTALSSLPLVSSIRERTEAWRAGGAICTEMEASALYALGSVRSVRTGGIMLIGGHPDQSPMTPEELERFSFDRLFRATREGLRELILRDRNSPQR